MVSGIDLTPMKSDELSLHVVSNCGFTASLTKRCLAWNCHGIFLTKFYRVHLIFRFAQSHGVPVVGDDWLVTDFARQALDDYLHGRGGAVAELGSAFPLLQARENKIHVLKLLQFWNVRMDLTDFDFQSWNMPSQILVTKKSWILSEYLDDFWGDFTQPTTSYTESP